MALTNDFMEAVQSGKVMRVRIMLKDSLLVDPTGVQFDEMERYAISFMSGIYEKHDGEQLNYDVSAWNEDYLNEQMVAIVEGFSKERIDLLKSMVRYMYKEKASKIRNERNGASASYTITRKQIGTGVTIAGAVLTVTGFCVAHTALTIGGVVMSAAGVALIVSDKGRD